MIAAANTAAFSFFPPLAACTAAADFCREAEETFFFDFLVGDFRGFFAAGLLSGFDGGRPGPLFVPVFGLPFAFFSGGIGG
jgi:hypothetical protein